MAAILFWSFTLKASKNGNFDHWHQWMIPNTDFQNQHKSFWWRLDIIPDPNYTLNRTEDPNLYFFDINRCSLTPNLSIIIDTKKARSAYFLYLVACLCEFLCQSDLPDPSYKQKSDSDLPPSVAKRFIELPGLVLGLLYMNTREAWWACFAWQTRLVPCITASAYDKNQHAQWPESFYTLWSKIWGQHRYPMRPVLPARTQ